MATGSSWKMARENMVKLPITEARKLARSALLAATGYTEDDADAIVDHIMDAQLRGYGSTGLSRIITFKSHVRAKLLRKIEVRNAVSSGILSCQNLSTPRLAKSSC